MKKEIVYTMPCETEIDKQLVEDLKYNLYQKYSEVTVYPNGLYEVRVVALVK